MNNSKKTIRRIKDQKGVTVIMVAVMMVVLIGFLALAIDVGYSLVVRNELQNIADGAALAACRELGEIYRLMPPAAQSTYDATDDKTLIFAKAYDVGQNNRSGGKTSTDIIIEDVRIGIWGWDSESFTETHWLPDAVQVTARRDSIANKPIMTFFARVLGVDTLDVRALATAALSGPSYVEEGVLKTPFGLSQNMFPDRCGESISFSPTSDSCAGWHNFFDSINANAMGEKLLGFIQGDVDCADCGGLWNGPTWLSTNFGISVSPEETPLASTGDSFYFQGGDIASLFLTSYFSDYDGNTGTIEGNPQNPAPIIALFDYFKYRDGDGDDSIWTAIVPVYRDSVDCDNTNRTKVIIGFAKIEILSVHPPPDKSLSVRIECENIVVIEGRGGGTTYGNVRGNIPNLVE